MMLGFGLIPKDQLNRMPILVPPFQDLAWPSLVVKFLNANP